MKTVSIEEDTYKRLTSLLKEIMHEKRRDVNYDDVINELIDVYQENSWGHFGASAGGG
jgi:predicted CopG family antitoxin